MCHPSQYASNLFQWCDGQETCMIGIKERRGESFNLCDRDAASVSNSGSKSKPMILKKIKNLQNQSLGR